MKKTNTKKTLLISIIALMLCVALALGATYAWFTDSVTSGTNKIVAGNLDVEVYYALESDVDKTTGKIAEASWKNLEGTDDLFTEDQLWEPGVTRVVYLKVKNAGTLALEYEAVVSPIDEKGGINVYGNSFKLSEYLQFGTVLAEDSENPTFCTTREEARTKANSIALSTGLSDTTKDSLTGKGSILAGGNSDYVTLVVYMPESVDNKANYKTGTVAPEIDLGITVYATQYNYEEDSFDETYDKDAKYDSTGNPTENNITYYNYFQQTYVETKGSAAEQTIEGNGLKVTIPAGANKDADSVVVKADPSSSTPNFTIGTDEESHCFDIDVLINGTSYSGDNLYTVQFYCGEGKNITELYHGTDVMTLDSNLDDEDDYTYDSDTGYVTMVVTHFSEFFAICEKPVVAIGSKAYYSVKQAIEAAEANDTIDLIKDVTSETVTIDKAITLNLNGNTFKKTVTVNADVNLVNTGAELEDDEKVTLNVAEGCTVEQDTNVKTVESSDSQGSVNTVAGENEVVDNSKYVASVTKDGKTYLYATLTEANAAVPANGTVNVLADSIELTGLKAGITYVGKDDKTTVTNTMTGSSFNVTLKNFKFVGASGDKGGAFRWCYTKAGETCTIDNCEFAPTAKYGIHFDENKGSLVVKNSTITGTVALAAGNNVSFENCKFAGKGESGYCNINFYSDATFTNCTFAQAYTGGSARGILMASEKGTEKITMIGCSVEEGEGTLTDVFRSDYCAGLGIIKATASTDAKDCTYVTSNKEFSVTGYDAVAVDGKENVYTLVEHFDAKIGDTKYKTFAQALAAAKSGDTITLVGNVNPTNNMTFDKTVTIDMAGYTMTRATEASGGYSIKLNPGCDLTIKNGTWDVAAAFGNITAEGKNGTCNVTYDNVTFTNSASAALTTAEIKAKPGNSTELATNVFKANMQGNFNVNATFKDCVFNNAKVEFSGFNEGNTFDAKFTNCEFNNVTNSGAIKADSYGMSENCKLEVTGCTFNITSTSYVDAVANGRYKNNTSVKCITVTLKDNKVNLTTASSSLYNVFASKLSLYDTYQAFNVTESGTTLSGGATLN